MVKVFKLIYIRCLCNIFTSGSSESATAGVCKTLVFGHSGVGTHLPDQRYRLETVFGCHTTYNGKTRGGGDYQTPPRYLGLGDSGWKSGVLHPDTNCMSSLANGILRVGRIEPNPNQYRVSILDHMLLQLSWQSVVLKSRASAVQVCPEAPYALKRAWRYRHKKDFQYQSRCPFKKNARYIGRANLWSTVKQMANWMTKWIQ